MSILILAVIMLGTWIGSFYRGVYLALKINESSGLVLDTRANYLIIEHRDMRRLNSKLVFGARTHTQNLSDEVGRFGFGLLIDRPLNGSFWRYGVKFPIWLLICVAVPPLSILVTLRRVSSLQREGKCSKCGYDRRAHAATAPCPECGTVPAPDKETARVARLERKARIWTWALSVITVGLVTIAVCSSVAAYQQKKRLASLPPPLVIPKQNFSSGNDGVTSTMPTIPDGVSGFVDINGVFVPDPPKPEYPDMTVVPGRIGRSGWIVYHKQQLAWDEDSLIRLLQTFKTELLDAGTLPAERVVTILPARGATPDDCEAVAAIVREEGLLVKVLPP